jgi:hypothetical protein
MARLGVELGKHGVRGVRVDTWPTPSVRVTEIAWDAENFDEALPALSELGPVKSIAVAIDLPLLFVKRLTLPAVSAAERRSILQLEPERFFPLRSEDVVPSVRDGPLIFAVRTEPLARWVSALERLAPVDLVEPAPITLARALGNTALRSAVVIRDHGSDGLGWIDMVDGVVAGTRRLFRPESGFPTPGREGPSYLTPWDDERSRALATMVGELRPLPPVGGVADAFVPAYGALLGLSCRVDLAGTLVSSDHAQVIRARRRRRMGLAVAAWAAGLLFALLSVDARKTRATRDLTSALAGLRAKAAPALALQDELQALTRRTEGIRHIAAERPDPLRVLGSLSRSLPKGAFVRGLHGAGLEWQVEGYAPSAAQVVAALGKVSQFRDVRFLSAMNRAQFGSELYESFALAFRFVPAP